MRAMFMPTRHCVQGVVRVVLQSGADSEAEAKILFIDALAKKLNFTLPEKGAGSFTFAFRRFATFVCAVRWDR